MEDLGLRFIHFGPIVTGPICLYLIVTIWDGTETSEEIRRFLRPANPGASSRSTSPGQGAERLVGTWPQNFLSEADQVRNPKRTK